MFKKIFFALILLFAGTVAASFCPNRASALELDKDSDIYKKIIRQNIKDCYLNEPLSNKVFPKNYLPFASTFISLAFSLTASVILAPPSILASSSTESV